MIKTPAEIALMAEAGRLLASVFTHLDAMTLEGLSTLEIDRRVEAFIVDELKARPASKGQYGYGFVLNSGDIVNLDITLEKDGFIADSSKTYLIGSVGPQARRLVRTTYEALWKGIQAVRPGAKLGDIGFAIEKHARKSGYSVVRDYCGHGIGREMHEEPQVLHFGKAGTGVTLREGMTFTIEPMLNQGVRTVLTEDDGWTVVTSDGKLSAQFEHTVAVTKDGVRVLTLRPDEKTAA